MRAAGSVGVPERDGGGHALVFTERPRAIMFAGLMQHHPRGVESQRDRGQRQELTGMADFLVQNRCAVVLVIRSDKGDEITYVLESPIMGRATAESVVHIVNELDVKPVIAVDGGDDVAKCVDLVAGQRLVRVIARGMARFHGLKQIHDSSRHGGTTCRISLV